MELTLTDEQALLAQSARAWVARSCPPARARELEAAPFDPELWREVASLGWAGLPVPEEHGGGGAGMLELVIVAEALGEGAVPTPLLASTVLTALPLLWAGGTPRDRLLSRVAQGELIGTLAILELGMRDEWDPVAMPDAPPLRGTKVLVPWGEVADVLVVVTTGGLRLVERDAAGIRFAPHHVLGGDPLAVVELDGASAEPIGADGASSVLRRTLDHAAVAQLAYTVGVAETMLTLTVRHATDRHQFGRPIGTFQAVAHRCAEMRAEVDACRYLAYQAAWALDRGHAYETELSAALAYAKDAIRRVARHTHQVHGAIGFSTEHDLHLYSRRAKAFELAWGSAGRYRDRLATAMGLTPAP
jgi:alkylation response protein AidB-like acyl-CoA dehydrogenase